MFSTLQLAQLFFATAAALCLTTEYSSGTTPFSLQAVPRRGVLYVAKAVFLFVTGTVMGIVGWDLAPFRRPSPPESTESLTPWT